MNSHIFLLRLSVGRDQQAKWRKLILATQIHLTTKPSLVHTC